MVCPFKPPRSKQCENKAECHTCKRMGHEPWCASLCGGCEVDACTCGALAKAIPRQPRQPIGLWTTPTTSSGRFEEAKRSGDVLRGATRDDLTEWWPFHWLAGRGYDNLHITLGVAALMGLVGLTLHAFGVFV